MSMIVPVMMKVKSGAHTGHEIKWRIYFKLHSNDVLKLHVPGNKKYRLLDIIAFSTASRVKSFRESKNV